MSGLKIIFFYSPTNTIKSVDAAKNFTTFILPSITGGKVFAGSKLFFFSSVELAMFTSVCWLCTNALAMSLT